MLLMVAENSWQVVQKKPATPSFVLLVVAIEISTEKKLMLR
ncbi:hypothetical protein RDABS01_018262 [Bienertia sinuspersici]